MSTVNAWMTAGFMRSKKMPPLNKVIANRRPASAPPQSVAQQEFLIRVLQARLGGTLVTKEGNA